MPPPPCSSCGAVPEADARFCGACGRRLADTPEPASSPRPLGDDHPGSAPTLEMLRPPAMARPDPAPRTPAPLPTHAAEPAPASPGPRPVPNVWPAPASTPGPRPATAPARPRPAAPA